MLSLFVLPIVTAVRYLDDREDVPDVLEQGCVYVVGTTTYAKWAIFSCPCARGHRLEVDLQRSHWPHWRFSLAGGWPSLYPSIHVATEPYCHFWLSRGKVFWTPSRPRRSKASRVSR